MTKPLQYEPALVIALIAAAISVLIAFGVRITSDQSTAIMQFAQAVLNILPFIVGAIVTRQIVWCPASVDALVEMKDVEIEQAAAR